MSLKIKNLPHEEFFSKRFQTVKTPYFLLKTKKNGDIWGRFGVVAGKSAGKTAVKRNFLKRQARETLFKELIPGNDVLIIFSRGAGDVTKKGIKEELVGVIKSAQK